MMYTVQPKVQKVLIYHGGRRSYSKLMQTADDALNQSE